MKIALVQMQSTANLERNLAAMEQSVKSAAKKGANLIVFPEMAYFNAPLKQCAPVTQGFAQHLALFSAWARHYGVALVPGTLREPGPEGKHYNTLPVFNAAGEILSSYRKIFLFKARLPDREYDEGSYTAAGNSPALFTLDGVCIGLSICFDLRFPELFRTLKKRGADLVLLPCAFTVPTGRVHWEPLLRARAIENQFHVAAVGLVGRSGNGAATYGNSMVIDPWGKIRARAAAKPTLVMFQYDAALAERTRAQLDAWSGRREDLFPIP